MLVFGTVAYCPICQQALNVVTQDADANYLLYGCRNRHYAEETATRFDHVFRYDGEGLPSNVPQYTP